MFNVKKSLVQFFKFLKYSLWIKPALYSLSSILIVYVVYCLQFVAFFQINIEVKNEILTSLLNILTSSMLAVFVFAVGAMVSAYANATNVGSPRILNLVLADDSMKNATSSFIAAFVYAATTTIAYKSQYFNKYGEFLLLVSTIICFYWVIYVFILWMDSVAKLGQAPTLINKTKCAVESSLKTLKIEIGEKYNHKSDTKEFSSGELYLNHYGFVSSIDYNCLESICEKNKIFILMKIRVGHQVNANKPIMLVSSKITSDKVLEDIKSSISLVSKRDQIGDVFFNLSILSEIAAKALSPGINDPGTALDVINTSTQCLEPWFDLNRKKNDEVSNYIFYDYNEITMDLINSAYENIRQYGLDNLNVAKKMVVSLQHLISFAVNEEDKKVLNAQLKSYLEQASAGLSYGNEKNNLSEYFLNNNSR